MATDGAAVDARPRQLVLDNGDRLGYDALLIAIGADAEATVGGGTLTPWDWGEGHAFRSILDALGKGKAKSVAFIVPAGLTWPLPLYELALLTGAHLRKEGIPDVSLSLLTVERAPLEVFGPRSSAAVAAVLERRGIALITQCAVSSDEEGRLRTSSGASIAADVTAAVPVIRARTLDGPPTDGDGFIAVDDHCRVRNTVNVFAAGDCTDGPVKQGGLAAQQADTAAATIATLAGAAVSSGPYRPELHAVLLTGEAPLHLTATGARPIPSGESTAHPHPGEKILARYLTPYLTQATPPLQLETPG